MHRGSRGKGGQPHIRPPWIRHYPPLPLKTIGFSDRLVWPNDLMVACDHTTLAAKLEAIGYSDRQACSQQELTPLCFVFDLFNPTFTKMLAKVTDCGSCRCKTWNGDVTENF